MSRPGVTYAEVAEAASQLIGQGRNPTIEQIRLILGTGSSTTIANHMKVWKGAQSDTSLISSKEHIPEELIAIVKGLWERVIMLSDDKLKTITANNQTTLMATQEELDKYRQNNQRWQHMYHQWNKEKNSLSEERSVLENEVRELKQQHLILQTRYELALQELCEKHDRIQELHHLQQQSQQNLEHYRESVQAQRLDDQQKFSAQKQEWQTELANKHVQVATMQQAAIALQSQYQLLDHNYQLLQEKNSEIIKTIQTQNEELKQSTKLSNEQMRSAQHWQLQYQETQQLLKEATEQYIQSQVERKSQLQQLADLQLLLERADDLSTRLGHEKLALIQEKSLLEGRLQQWQLTAEPSLA